MVPLAAESAAPQLPLSQPVRRKAIAVVPQPRRRVPVAHLVLFAAGWLLVVGAALQLLVRYDAINRLARSNDQANAQLARLEAENQALQQQVDQLSSLDRIQKLATSKLHMVAPAKVAVAHVDPSLLAQGPAPAVAARPQTVAEAGLWQQIAAWWQRWRGGGNLAKG